MLSLLLYLFVSISCLYIICHHYASNFLAFVSGLLRLCRIAASGWHWSRTVSLNARLLQFLRLEQRPVYAIPSFDGVLQPLAPLPRSVIAKQPNTGIYCAFHQGLHLKR